jgi:hypothetical protein
MSETSRGTKTSAFGIRVVDDATGRGVPLVELTTVHNLRYVTDSAGVAAIDAPELLNQRVFFYIKSHGYAYPADGFGYRGKAVQVVPGKIVELPIKRMNIAERLYRMTGAGIYADSVAVGLPVPINEPLLNAGVFGSDSVVNAVFQDKIYWFWGDTNFPQYPLGNFHVPGATSKLPRDGLSPSQGIDLEYFLNARGQAKETCRMPGDGPTWLGRLTVLTDQSGQERMFARYAKTDKAMRIKQRGLVEFDPAENVFRHLKLVDRPDDNNLGHPFRVTEGGVDYIYFASPFPTVRVRATVSDFLNPETYEAYSCLRYRPGSSAMEIVRAANGQPDYAWHRDRVPMDLKVVQRLLKEKVLMANEIAFQLRDSDSGKAIIAHRGSIAWNKYRNRWIMIATQSMGTSMLGEVWYAEADSPIGPWQNATKIVTHDKYSFYNPRHHSMLDEHEGRVIYFEGTYTNTFSGNPDRTPRYNYNQVMYRLDLSDKRLGGR